MGDCCEKDDAIDALRERQSSTLKIVLAINISMFVAGIGAGIYAGSSALLSDSLDNLGDAMTYGLSLYVVYKASRAKAQVAFFKGGLILLAALIVLGQVIYKLIVPTLPIFEIMGVVSLFSLVANSVCLFLLTRHREDDVNMSSVWECSRNDIASNISVFLAAGAVWFTQSGWPDIVIALCLVGLFLRSAIRVFTSAARELKTAIEV
ncbi:MAG TPA: cation transporter [Pyrinomonadaceae bacterium]|nr:cation transporter [Pyrinomonadaceae bacterium]HMP64120.1 cation transporter [Pyrinomonadaceae bacterium]